MQRWILAAWLLLGVGVAGCSTTEREAPQGGGAAAGVQAAEPAQAPPATAAAGEAAQGAEVVYVDVRTPQEYETGHVEGALNIPHDQMPARWQELEQYRGRRLVLYCRSGRRSALAISVLEKQGFPNLENGGSLQDVVQRGAPLAR